MATKKGTLYIGMRLGTVKRLSNADRSCQQAMTETTICQIHCNSQHLLFHTTAVLVSDLSTNALFYKTHFIPCILHNYTHNRDCFVRSV